MGDNEFKYLNKEEFSRLPRLHTLYLDGNQISAIVDHAFHSAQLQVLTLGHNRIVRIDRLAFFNATIQRLDLSANKFESLDKLTFGELRTRDTLRALDLSKNPRLKITPLIVILGENPQLESLSLAYNDLDELPLDLFELQGNLRQLNLSGNRISELHLHQLSHLHNLQVLDLSNNRLKGMDADILNHIDRAATFQTINLEGNPWQCDLCHIVPLLKWVQRTHLFKDGCAIGSTGPACIRCSGPPILQGRSLLSLEEPNLEWCSNDAEPVSILPGVGDPQLGLFLGCFLIILILISAAVCVIAKNRYHAAHYYTREGERPEIATPPVPPPQDAPLFPENHANGNGTALSNGNNGTNGVGAMLPPTTTPLPNNNGFDNLLFQQYQQHHNQNNGSHQIPVYPQQQQWTTSPGSGVNRDKMIATIEEMTYETQLAYPELAPINLQPAVNRHPYPSSSSSPSSRSTPIYCCPGHHHNNNNHNGRGGSPPQQRSGGWSRLNTSSNTNSSSSPQESFRRY